MHRRTNKPLYSALLVAISFMICGSPSALAQKVQSTAGPQQIESPQDLVQWMTYYYMHPQPQLLVPAVLYADAHGLIDPTKGEAPLTAFLSQVFAQNPKKIFAWCDQLSPAISKKGLPMLWSACWWSNTTEGKEALNKMISELPEKSQDLVRGQLAKAPEPIDQREVKNGAVLDELWGAFTATGDDKYVLRVMSTLPWTYDPAGDYNKLAIGGAARWSLTSNAQQHPKVKELVTRMRQTHPEWKKALDQVLADASKTASSQTSH